MPVLFNKNNIAYLHSQLSFDIRYRRYRLAPSISLSLSYSIDHYSVHYIYGFRILIASNIQNFVLSVTSSESIITNLLSGEFYI
jgi:hypothetical protein